MPHYAGNPDLDAAVGKMLEHRAEKQKKAEGAPIDPMSDASSEEMWSNKGMLQPKPSGRPKDATVLGKDRKAISMGAKGDSLRDLKLPED